VIPRLFAAVRSITHAFDGGRLVEIKIAIESDQPYQGELYLRVPAYDADRFEVGQVLSLKMVRVE
jgi:hypothetical protein